MVVMVSVMNRRHRDRLHRLVLHGFDVFQNLPAQVRQLEN